MKVGIMGGTFDPIHLGHLLAGERVREAIGLDEVWFMPSYIPPHKHMAPEALSEHRWNMVCLAIENHPQFRPLDIELIRQGTSYTYDTLRQLREQHPQVEFYFIIGGDMVQYLPKWYKIEQLVHLTSFVGLERAGVSIEWQRIPANLRERITMVPMPALAISSTEIRTRRKQGLSVRYMVSEPVFQYIEEHNLYGS